MSTRKENNIMLVRDLMHVGVMTCSANTPVVEAIHLLLNQNLESVLVLDDNGHTAGVFGRREAIKIYTNQTNAGNWQTLTVADAMQTNILEVPPDIPATAAAQIMLDQDTRDIYLLHYAGGIGWPAATFRFDEVLRYLGAESDEEVAAMGVGAPRKSGIEFFRDRYSKVK